MPCAETLPDPDGRTHHRWRYVSENLFQVWGQEGLFYQWQTQSWVQGKLCKCHTLNTDVRHPPGPHDLDWITLRSSPQITWNMCFFVVPIGSMYGIHPYIWLIFMVNVGKYTIHGSYGFEAIDDETFTPSIHPFLKTPRILRSFNTEWSNTSCTFGKGRAETENCYPPGLPNISPWCLAYLKMIFRTSRLVGYVIVPWRVLQFFQLETPRSFSIPFCKISLRSLKAFPGFGSKHQYSQISQGIWKD